ncbi:hypothetical protein FALBO_13235 [Fusarium albosuccineum]|uniref:Cyclin-dependent kinase n=1 Tax=Fusarium albosuccineum TaxID=1237068 RepID=A0A8H4KYY2_9HYPO|nr:hypothetical protein FALBO_13235 [Fusarium albosuccineum]
MDAPTTTTTNSPARRRALAPLDSNALAAPKILFKPGTTAPGHSPVKMAIEGRKRMLELEGAAASPAGKKACLGRDEDASERSASPDVSSVFDTSANDASWATAATEPDAITLAATATTMLAATTAAASTTPALATTSASSSQEYLRRGTLTRQQVRERAETLRLRLSLANYKVRTGQTTVPLSQLQKRPLPRRDTTPRVVRVQSPTASDDSDVDQRSPQHHRSSSDSQRTEIMEFPDE